MAVNRESGNRQKLWLWVAGGLMVTLLVLVGVSFALDSSFFQAGVRQGRRGTSQKLGYVMECKASCDCEAKLGLVIESPLTTIIEYQARDDLRICRWESEEFIEFPICVPNKTDATKLRTVDSKCRQWCEETMEEECPDLDVPAMSVQWELKKGRVKRTYPREATSPLPAWDGCQSTGEYCQL